MRAALEMTKAKPNWEAPGRSRRSATIALWVSDSPDSAGTVALEPVGEKAEIVAAGVSAPVGDVPVPVPDWRPGASPPSPPLPLLVDLGFFFATR